jgi:hypothetical protein
VLAITDLIFMDRVDCCAGVARLVLAVSTAVSDEIAVVQSDTEVGIIEYGDVAGY